MSYSNVRNGLSTPGPAWSTVLSTIGAGGRTTTAIEVYTSFSTASSGFGRWQSNHITPTTITPVYALGSPIQKVTVTTIPSDSNAYTITQLTGPTPNCKFETMSVKSSTDCGQCTITGGTVDLYFWPLETAGPSDTTTRRSTILNGTTLYSPTVYIHLPTIYASNTCLQVGARHTGTLLAMPPDQLSTQIDIGLKQPAYRYGKLNYTDLLRPPPAWQYEMQPECYVFGCPTIYNTQWFPTLKVPEQVRTIDPEWAGCGLALEGFYDPPIALTPKAVEARVSTFADPDLPKASPSLAVTGPEATWYPKASSLTSAEVVAPIDPLATIVKSGLKARPTHHTRHSTHSLDNNASKVSNVASTSTRIDSDTSERTAQNSNAGASWSPDPASTAVESHSRAGPRPTDTTPISPSRTTHGTENDSRWTSQSLPDEMPAPHAITSDGGVIIGKHTLQPGEEKTIGNGAATAIVSVYESAGSTFVVYNHTSTTTLEEASLESRTNIAPTTSDLVSLNSKTQYVVSGQTLAPSSPITLEDNDGPVTFRMLTASSSTFIAIGTTTTVPLIPTTSDADPLAFTKASDGNFVLHGTTLADGKPITVGDRGDRTTLRMISVSGRPGVGVDGTTTRMLEHGHVSSNVASSSDSLPEITYVSAPPPGPASSATSTPTTTTVRSGSNTSAPWLARWFAIVVLFLVGFGP
ncbi:uncharacterized protein LTR77_003917 [Saxophila tyrrhenica]|uniref:Uncharacterized protein n=1 Tax=Saxophila tyrrhenica TaxID=1690608 RepID=A0AAV9PFQ1_9PEZI|nr:hypothetical protein LTR77_003917 [Saxophila tyrrhenica]